MIAVLIRAVGAFGAGVIMFIGGTWRVRWAVVVGTVIGVVLIGVAITTGPSTIPAPVIATPPTATVAPALRVSAWGEHEGMVTTKSGAEVPARMVFADITIDAGEADLSGLTVWLVVSPDRDTPESDGSVLASASAVSARWLVDGRARLVVNDQPLATGPGCAAVHAHQSCSLTAVWAVLNAAPVATQIEQVAVSTAPGDPNHAVAVRRWSEVAPAQDVCRSALAEWCTTG